MRPTLHVEPLEARELLASYYQTSLCASVFAAHNLPAGPVTLGATLPQGEAFGDLSLGGLETQTDIKTRWPDGSIRFAAVSAVVPATGNYGLTEGPKEISEEFVYPDGSFTVVLHTTDGDYVAAPGFAPTDYWLKGPIVSEARYSLIPYRGDGAAHPSLRIQVDSRSYVNGQTFYSLAFDNSLNVAGAGQAIYQASVSVHGEAAWESDWLWHPYMTRWRHQLSPSPLLYPDTRLDVSAFAHAGALPRYSESVGDFIDYHGGPAFEPLQAGSLTNPMNSHGGRAELGPYPDWTARYLAHTHNDQLDYVLKHGDLAGSWPVHLTNADGSWLDPRQHPTLWLDHGLWREGTPRGNYWETGWLMPDVAHQPSLAYVPYLVTADRFYADEMQAWANYIILASYGHALPNNEVRGIGWGLRNLTDASAYLPDDWTGKGYLENYVSDALGGFDDYARTHNPPLGTFWEWARPESWTGDVGWIALWEQSYVAWAIDHANKQGFTGGEPMLTRIVGFQMALANDPLTRDGMSPYIAPVASRIGGPYTHIRQTYVGYTPLAGFYGVVSWLAVTIALEKGMPGAQATLDWIIVQPEMFADLQYRAGYFTIGVT